MKIELLGALGGRALMPWRPPVAAPSDLDPRLAPFRERGGRLFRDDGTVVAEVYLQSSVYWRGRGWLWWKTWSHPVETVDAYVLDADGVTAAEYFVWGEGLDDEIVKWSAGTFEHEGEGFRVVWLDDAESRVLRERAGLEPAQV